MDLLSFPSALGPQWSREGLLHQLGGLRDIISKGWGVASLSSWLGLFQRPWDLQLKVMDPTAWLVEGLGKS